MNVKSNYRVFVQMGIFDEGAWKIGSVEGKRKFRRKAKWHEPKETDREKKNASLDEIQKWTIRKVIMKMTR